MEVVSVPKFKVMSVYDVVKGGGSARGAQPTSPLLLVYADVEL